MAYYPKTSTNIYNHNPVVFDVNVTKDFYCVDSHYEHDHETDEITHKHEVIKNWTYSEVPETGRVVGKKYKEILFSGSIKECHKFISDIVANEGHWIPNPEKKFEQIFIEPTV